RDEVIHELTDRGIDCRDYFPSIHLQPLYVGMFDYEEGSFPVSERICGLTIALPFYNDLEERDIDYICNTLKNIIRPYQSNMQD
ncbi:DegT/DnrJ/EryC1/StrS family aminotransferase, partial [Chloroflexota bacterium]